MIPNKEVWRNIQKGARDELSTWFKNICDDVYGYNMNRPLQQYQTAKETAIGRIQCYYRLLSKHSYLQDDDTKMKALLQG